MLTWEGVLLLFNINFTNGGYAGSVYGYLLVWFGTAASFATMGELASMAPTAGGQYHWIAILAPEKWRNFLSYLIGWLTMIGWQAISASGCFLSASLVQGLMVLNDPTYSPKPWRNTLLYIATVFFAVLVNIVFSLPKVELLVLVLHVCGFLAILIPLVYYAPHGSASDVFTLFLNEGHWPTEGLSFMVGIVGPVFNLLGADGAVHMSEEIGNPAKNVPRAMLFGIILNGSLGFGMLLAVLFCLGNLDAVLGTTTGFPFMEIFLQAVRSIRAALAMASFIAVLNICATISFVATASRMTWSFARDHGTPGWKWLGRVTPGLSNSCTQPTKPKVDLPLWSIGITAIVAILLGLVGLGSTVAFNVVVSLSINGLYTSYLLGNSVLLYRRLKGSIKPYSPSADQALDPINAQHLAWGPWKIPEPFGTIINIIGCIYMFVILIFSFWPIAPNPTPATMNFSSLMVGAVTIFSVVYYFTRGHKFYTGPRQEISLQDYQSTAIPA